MISLFQLHIVRLLVIGINLLQEQLDNFLETGVAANLVDTLIHFMFQSVHHFDRVLERARRLHHFHSVSLYQLIRCVLLEDVDQPLVLWIGPDGVQDGEGELALCEVLSKRFVLMVATRAHVEIVVQDLEECGKLVDKCCKIAVRGECTCT